MGATTTLRAVSARRAEPAAPARDGEVEIGERVTVLDLTTSLASDYRVVASNPLRPAAGEINPGQMIALVAAVGFGISIALVKSLTRTETTLRIIFWMIVIQSTAGFLPSLHVWQWPSA